VRRRNIIIAAVVIVVLVVASRVIAGGGLGQPQEIQPQGPASGSPGSSTPRAGSQTPSPGQQPEALPFDPSQMATAPGPLVLLNPSSGTRGSAVGVSGSGFDPGETIDIYVRAPENSKPQDLGFAQADGSGSFGGVSYSIPEDAAGGTFVIIAQQHNSDKRAEAVGQVITSSPSVKLGTQVGKAGDNLAVSGKGFIPGETVNVYFNSISTEPIATIKADSSGGLGRATVKIPYGAVGDNSLIFMGEKSQSPVTTPFLMLSFYPQAGVSEYAAKGDTTLTFSGSSFGPNERVLVYLNSLDTPPVAIIQADEQGSFSGAGSFVIPFQLKGKNTFIFVGEQTQSATTAGFNVLPYTPYAEASTYGGQPGTAVTFYGQGFAREEIVRIYLGRERGSPGHEVACFMTNNQGSIIGGTATYTIPANAEAGKLNFVLVGDKSQAEATAVVEVMQATGPFQPGTSEQAQQEYVCPYDKQQDGQ